MVLEYQPAVPLATSRGSTTAPLAVRTCPTFVAEPLAVGFVTLAAPEADRLSDATPLEVGFAIDGVPLAMRILPAVAAPLAVGFVTLGAPTARCTTFAEALAVGFVIDGAPDALRPSTAVPLEVGFVTDGTPDARCTRVAAPLDVGFVTDGAPLANRTTFADPLEVGFVTEGAPLAAFPPATADPLAVGFAMLGAPLASFCGTAAKVPTDAVICCPARPDSPCEMASEPAAVADETPSGVRDTETGAETPKSSSRLIGYPTPDSARELLYSMTRSA